MNDIQQRAITKLGSVFGRINSLVEPVGSMIGKGYDKILAPLGLDFKRVADPLASMVKNRYRKEWLKNVQNFDGKQWDPNKILNSWDVFKALRGQTEGGNALKALYYGVPTGIAAGGVYGLSRRAGPSTANEHENKNLNREL